MAVGFNRSRRKSFSKPRPNRYSSCLTIAHQVHRDHDPGSVDKWCTKEILKVSKDKRVLKFIQKRVGAHIHAKRKQKEISNVLAAMRKLLPRTTDGPTPSSINIYAEWGWGVCGGRQPQNRSLRTPFSGFRCLWINSRKCGGKGLS